MMLTDNEGGGFWQSAFHGAHHLFSYDRMNTHLGPFVLCQWGGLLQYIVGYSYFADVMEAGAECEGNKIRAGHAKLLAETNTESDDTFGMAFSLLVSGVECEREGSSENIPVLKIGLSVGSTSDRS